MESVVPSLFSFKRMFSYHNLHDREKFFYLSVKVVCGTYFGAVAWQTSLYSQLDRAACCYSAQRAG